MERKEYWQLVHSRRYRLMKQAVLLQLGWDQKLPVKRHYQTRFQQLQQQLVVEPLRRSASANNTADGVSNTPMAVFVFSAQLPDHSLTNAVCTMLTRSGINLHLESKSSAPSFRLRIACRLGGRDVCRWIYARNVTCHVRMSLQY